MATDEDFARARRNMIEAQVRANRVTDPLVIDAMSLVPRERFVPGPLRGIAYIDEDLNLGNGRHLLEPMVFARMLQAAEVRPNDAVLDVGCGSGYSAAVLARMVMSVVALEADPDLARAAERTLLDLGVDNVAVVAGDMAAGLPNQAPFDLIVLEGAVPEIPDALEAQLAEGGRLVGVVAGQHVGHAMLLTREGGSVGRRELFDAMVPMLPGFSRDAVFEF